MKYDDTFYLISKISSNMNNFIMMEIRRNGIKGIVTSHGSILVTLFKGPKLMNDISKIIGKTPQTVTTLVKKLEEFDYVKTEKSKSDKRSTMVALTKKGKDLYPLMESASENLFKKQYKGFSKKKIEEFRRLLNTILMNFEND